MPRDFQEFCGSPLMEGGFMWNSTNPEFSKCFQLTILVWIPCGYLFLVSPFYFCYLIRSTRRHIKRNWLNLTKMLLGIVLLLLCLADLMYRIYQHRQGDPVYTATLLAPAIKFLAMTIAVIFIEFGRKKGVQSTGILFIYWLLHLICCAFLFTPKLTNLLQEGGADTNYDMTLFGIFMVLIITQLVLAALVDEPPVFSYLATDQLACPEEMASFLSVISFWWITGMIIKGYRRPLQRSDLWTLNPQDSSKAVAATFDKQWKKEVEKSKKSTGKQEIKRKSEEEQMQLQPLKAGDEPFLSQPSAKNGVRQPKLIYALARSFGGTFLLGSLFKLMHDVLIFISPQLLKYLIQFTKDKTQPMWHGYFYTFLMFAVAFVQSMVLHQYFHKCFIVGMRLRTAVISAVYRKSLKLSNSARKTSTVGEIVNLMSVDAQRFMELTTYLNMLWSAPFQMIVALYFLWMILGPSVLAGVGVMFIMIPINAFIAKKNKILQIAQMKHKDSRIKLMNEVLNGIKVLKLYAWELSFHNKVLDIRNQELDVLKKSAYLNAAASFTWTCAPFLVSLTTFAVYVFSSADNILDAEKAFVSLALFNILRFPISMLPMLIGNIVQASVSSKRLQNFLMNEELDVDSVQYLEYSKNAVSIGDGTFSWENDQKLPTLQSLNLEIREGQLIAVVGQVGSGKSSLLSAILGEMKKNTGDVKIKGSLAYVAQQAWIQNATVQDNILFGQEREESKYDQVINACALNPDLSILPGGDLTEIGEKGITLSGGQKQRVSLARAVYANQDIYLLDDPLSAVDAHVGKHIFDRVIGPEGLLRSKTRILVTHGIKYLPVVDQIVVMVEGKVSEVGTYKQLLNQNGDFADFLRIYLEEDFAEVEETNLSLDEAQLREEILSHIGSIKDLHGSVTGSREKISHTRRDTARSETSVDSGTCKAVTHPVMTGTSLETLNNGTVDKMQEKAKKKDRLIEAETSETGMVKFSIFWSYMQSVGLWLSLAIIALYIMNNAASVGANFWLSEWSNDMETNATMDSYQRDLRLGVYGALGLAQGITIYLAAYALANGALVASTSLHKDILVNCLKSPMLFYDTTPLGRIINRFSKDIDVIDTLIPRNLEVWAKCTLHTVSSLLVISCSTPYFLAMAVPLGIFYYLVQRFYVASSRQLKRLESVSRSPIYSHFGETVQGASSIRAYHKQEAFILQSEDHVDENQVCYYPGIVANRWLAVRLELVGNTIVMFAALFAVIGRDHLSAGIVGLSVSYALNLTQVLNWMVRMTSELETNIVAVERVIEYSQTETEAAWVVKDKTPTPEWPQKGVVCMEDYSTRYRAGLDLVLKGISCHVTGGEKVGIVGRTGAGKSSLTLALFRIIEPAGGVITIDGVDISQIGLHDLRSKLTIIPQDPVLFCGSLRMNLDPFDVYSDQQVWSALEHAHLKAFALSLPEQLQYECSEGGDNLSVGQRQLVCLARALLRKTKVLILDEATAAIDLETDSLIQSTIRTEFSGCTVLTIAHRLNTIMDYDRIMVLDKGEIIELDKPATLVQNKSSLFYNMAKVAGLAD